jgi:hypothetical protein
MNEIEKYTINQRVQSSCDKKKVSNYNPKQM